jgi:acyl-CoA reductase-like NAD-dependent aldehyde dehydrogenase
VCARVSLELMCAQVAFTGSVAVGSQIMSACAKVRALIARVIAHQHPPPSPRTRASQDIRLVTLELGGKSPIVVFEDADVDAVVEWVMVGIFFNQARCTVCGCRCSRTRAG